MRLAIQSVKEGSSLRKAAEAFCVPKDALLRRIQGKLKSLDDVNLHKVSLGHFKQTLSE